MTKLLAFLQVCLKVGFFQIPLCLLIHVLSNTSKLLAPQFTFKIAMKMFEKVKIRSFSFKIESVEDLDYIFSWDIKQRFIEKTINDVLKQAKVGSEAPNPIIFNMTTSKLTPLLSLSKQGRPLVLNFGSCT